MAGIYLKGKIMFCTQCGNQIGQVKFCPTCGCPAEDEGREGRVPQGHAAAMPAVLMKNSAITEIEKKEKKEKTLTAVIYGLYAASFFFGITGIIAIMINYIKKNDVVGTYLESHYQWQIGTFWKGLINVLIGFVMIFSGWWGTGMFLIIFSGIFIIFRIVKGWLRLNDEKPMDV